MARALRFGFTAVGDGWAQADIARGSVSVSLRVSATTADPVGGLVRAAASLTTKRSATHSLLWDAEGQVHALTVSRYGDAAEVRVQTRTLSGDTVLLLELKDSLDGLVAATLDLANSLDRTALIDGFRADPWPDEEILQLREAAFRAPPSVLPTV